MAWIVRQFECEECAWTGEELFKVGEEEEVLPCPGCAQELKPALCAPPLGMFSMADKEGQADILRRRSVNHTRQEVNKEPEKYGMKETAQFRDGKVFSAGGITKKTE